CCMSETSVSMIANDDSMLSNFQYLWDNISSIKLPDASWGSHATEIAGFRSIIFSEAVFSKSKELVFRKKVLYRDDKDGFQLLVLNRPIDAELLFSGADRRPKTTNNMI